jgi:hypothetical protein
MDYPLVIGLLVVFVVGFFAYQWISKRPGPVKHTQQISPMASGSAQADRPQVKEEQFPTIAGQTQAEALTKEPDQRREPSSQQVPALSNGEAPAQFDQHLRHPEQLFHQPAPTPQMTDVASGRASEGPVPTGAGQQAFNPEMAQNGGAFLGNSVFAYDGMEPTGFTSF